MAFPDIPNFRPIAGTKLYRTSKLDNLDYEGIERMKALNIMAILDLRSPEGWEDGATNKDKYFPIDSHYEAFSAKFSSRTRKTKDAGGNKTTRETTFSLKQLTGRTPPNEIVPAAHGRRLFLNLIDKEFAFGLLRTVVPWYKIPWIVVLMVSFLLCRTRLFLREFARIVMNPIGIIGQYQSIVKFCGQSVHATLTILSNPSHVPAVVCCAQGKDRTGIISALVMSVCGSSREEIVKEYAASEECMMRMSEAMQRYTASYFLSPEFGTAKAKTMEDLLDFIDRDYGSVEKYLESIGFCKDQQEQLRQNVSA